MQVEFDSDTTQELLGVADWYGISPQDFIRSCVQRRLDEIADSIAPNLPVFDHRYYERLAHW